MALSIIAILAVLLADMQESTGTDFAVAVSLRDNLRAEYMAKSGMNLTRLLVANEPTIRKVVAPLYQMALGRPPPELPVWEFADTLLQPFCQYESIQDLDVGVDFQSAQGLGKSPGTCEIRSVAENAKINVNDPLFRDGNAAKKEVALQLFAMMGGYQSPSPFDPLFSGRDDQGQFTSRLDIISSLVDWWDPDQQRTTFDPGRAEIATAGSEDDPYARYEDPYVIKNAPFDSIEEIRLVRGVSDDFWATFVEPEPDDIQSRKITVYGSGSVNPNSAPPEVLLARLCSIVGDTTLCIDPLEAAKFTQLLGTIRSIAPIPFFTRAGDFLNFVEGKGGARDLYPLVHSMLGDNNPLLFKPINISDQKKRQELASLFVTSARIIMVESTGVVGRARVRERAVINFHDRWTPPPPNAGTMPKLGIFHYYRVD
ncbi:MAG: general secretion pathway protein GspK [Myxococcales bacterium]|nr:general secretion pathway protein GspK [Myxococcales bacterium]